MKRNKVVIGTRGSQLALWQSNWTADRLREVHPGLEVELEIIKTSGDRFQEQALQALGGKGAFTKEIQDALLHSRVDVAVHSLKDLPTQQIPGLVVWAHPERFDPRDAWIGRDGMRYLDLPEQGVVATGSLRRGAQVQARFPEATVEQLRGNVGTRLRKFAEGQMTGMFLAYAGMVRLELTEHATEVLDPEIFLPAPGQGALAIEGRDDDETRELLEPLDHADTRVRIAPERAFLATLEGGCQVPIAALAQVDGDEVVLDGLLADIDGSRLMRDTHRGPRERAAEIGVELAQRLVNKGGDEILKRIRASVGG
jgi:hydroxymethylbilane synthase